VVEAALVLLERIGLVIGGIRCQDITTRHIQQIVNAAPTPGEGGRVRGIISGALAGRGPRAAPCSRFDDSALLRGPGRRRRLLRTRRMVFKSGHLLRHALASDLREGAYIQ
jgi:hypothetical protein